MNIFSNLRNQLNRKIFLDGLTSFEFISKRNLKISPNKTLGDLIETGLKSGDIKWIDQKLSFNYGQLKIFLNPEEQKILKRIVLKTGLLPSELICGSIRKYLIKGKGVRTE
ncbi:hypothetical protein A2V56_05420 [Candidatus Woesebacteria bacterium RBG_19FT_COMBO_42_9]|uniref:Uncharacterized protein n=1 Tax=Candidatus Woesebacteria bacterium RBG_16_42_24 TaxID=1802485 RepID=A0A1F7XLH8_9BACT|nr:MAG: hypothetical protein A2V97_03725 [Candidatus Woesebacteria bacterium RBG_16_42_24]OGM17317.1 MAG: hypothetical protein A2V56_05420 [Candidatus Woesebacteria bacterium RBG_19FT_COMBO_42_9]OGM67246.1 MAG: hypothetical protein A2985_03800 [Candidatus Woesebacteria bacterium RIFCSPLOWO2_01_FULL_43_11]